MRLRGAQQSKPVGHRRRHRLLTIDVLAGGNRLAQRRNALLGGRGIEEDRKIRFRQCRIEICGPVLDTVGLRQAGERVAVAPEQQQARHDAVGAGGKPAFGADRRQRVGQMLGRADAPGGAVENDTDFLDRHGLSYPS